MICSGVNLHQQLPFLPAPKYETPTTTNTNQIERPITWRSYAAGNPTKDFLARITANTTTASTQLGEKFILREGRVLRRVHEHLQRSNAPAHLASTFSERWCCFVQRESRLGNTSGQTISKRVRSKLTTPPIR